MSKTAKDFEEDLIKDILVGGPTMIPISGKVAPEDVGTLLEMIKGVVSRFVASNEVTKESMDRLRAASTAYDQTRIDNPFNAGDFVTPLEGYGVKYAGVPHIVLEALHPTQADASFNGQQDSNSYGMYNDMRVAVLIGGEVTAFWAETYTYRKMSEEEIAKLDAKGDKP